MHATRFRPWGEPRLLFSVDAPDGDGAAPLLSAWVSCCAGPGERSPHTGHVTLEGELCAYTSSVLRDPLLDFAAYAGELVVDLSNLQFIDSSGVALLEDVTSRQLAQGGFVRLHDPTPFVRKVMRLVAAARAEFGADGPARHSAAPAGVSSFDAHRGSATTRPAERQALDIGVNLLQALAHRSAHVLDEVSFSRI